MLEIDYQKKIDKFNVLVDVPLIMPLDVLNDTGYIVLEASKNTEIITEKSGLNDIETYEIPKWPSYTPSNRIVESLRYFTRPFTFRTAVTRRDESPVLASIAESETLSYTFDIDSAVFFEFIYIIKNTNLQFLEIKLPSKFELWGATIQGKGIKPRKGEDDLLLIPLPVDTSENIVLLLTGQISGDGKASLWKSLVLDSPKLSIPSLRTNVNIYFPSEYSLFNISGNFENFPEPDHKKPILVSLYKNLTLFFFQNVGHMTGPLFLAKKGIQGRFKSAVDDIGGQFKYAEMEQIAPRRQRMLDGKDKQLASVQDEPYDLSTGYNIGRDETITESYGVDASKKPAAVKRRYKRKKGILSLNINIPKEGDSLSVNKLWGNSRLSLTFVSETWKKSLVLFSAFLFAALGFHLKKRDAMTPFAFLMTTSLLCTLIPMVMMRSLIFLFNGAILGAFIFVLILLFISFGKTMLKKLGFNFVIIFLLIAGSLFSSQIVYAKEAKPFPFIKVYIPYKGDAPLNLKDAENVYIPTEDYFKLKFIAQPPYKPEDVFKYENDFDISGFRADGSLEENRIKFTASFDIFVNTDDWALVGLPFRNVYIEELMLDGKPIPVKTNIASQEISKFSFQQIAYNNDFVPQRENYIYEIPILGSGHHLIDLVFYVELESLPGKKSLDFGFPQTICSDLSLDFKSKDIFLEFENPQDGFFIDDSGNSTVAKVSLSQRSDLRVSWFPKKYLKKEEKPLIYTKNEVNIFMGYEDIFILQQTNIRVEKSSIASLSFQKDANLEIIDVFSDKLKNWKIRDEKGASILEIIFKHEILNSADMLIKAKYTVMPDSVENILFLKPMDAKRIMGNLNLYAQDDYKLAIGNIKGLRISENKNSYLSEFPDFNFQKTYSFLNENFNAEITRIPEERKYSVDILNFNKISENFLSSHYTVTLNIKKSSLSDIKIRIPQGLKVSSIIADGTSDYVIHNNMLTLPFTRAIKGVYKFDLKLEKELEIFDNTSIESIELLGAEKTTGTSLMLFPRGFEVKEEDTHGLRQANLHAIAKNFRSINPPDFGSKYAYTIRDNSYKANYKILKVQPVIDVVKVYHSIVRDNLVNVKLLNIFNIKNAPVDHFDIIAPSDLKDSIKIKGDGIKTILKKEINNGKDVYITINTISKIDHSYMLEISFNKYFGNKKSFEMPVIKFPQVSNRTEFLSIESATVYSVKPEIIQSLHETEPDVIPVLPAGIDLNNILWSYRASSAGEWKYSLKLKRLEREKMVKAKILREDIKTLLIPNGFALHEVNIKVNNRSLQFLPIYLPPEADLWSLKVAGESSRASLANQEKKNKYKKYLIPLIKSGAGDRSFDVALIYITPIKTFSLLGKIDLGMVETGDMSVEKTTWTLSVPENYSYFRFKTNMDEIDLSMIEAEKTLELAKEYKHWTSLASSSIGELREQAVSNQAKVRREYNNQLAFNRSVQTKLNPRIGDSNFNQNLVQTAQTKNIQMVNEANKIMESNRSVSGKRRHSRQVRGKQSINGRRNVRGWQFKTNDFQGESQVKESIDNYLVQEDTKQSMQAQQIQKDQVPQPFIQIRRSRSEIDRVYNEELEDVSREIRYKGKAKHDQRLERRKAELEKRLIRKSTKKKRISRRRSVGSKEVLQQRLDDGLSSSYVDEKLGIESPREAGAQYDQGGYSDAPQGAFGVDGDIYDKEESFKVMAGEDALQHEYWGGPAYTPASEPQVIASQKIAPKVMAQKKSSLLKGLRSINIPIPDQGRKFSFKKLGGNPRLAIYYRKKGILSKIFLFLLCILAGIGSLKMRKYDLPFDKVIGFLKNIKIMTILNRIIDSKAFKIITFIVMVVSMFIGSPLFLIALGFASIFFIRFASAKRYEKIGYVPSRSIAKFFKDLPANVILVSLALSFFEIKFLFLFGFATFVNYILATIYGICTSFIPKAIKDEPTITK